jgi:hypothetical protein
VRVGEVDHHSGDQKVYKGSLMKRQLDGTIPNERTRAMPGPNPGVRPGFLGFRVLGFRV